MAEAFITDTGKSWELIEVFDDLKLKNEVSVDKGANVHLKGNDELPGITSEYREFCNNHFHSGIVSLEDLHKLLYNPLKNKYPDKFQGKKQDIEFYSVYTLDGKKLYRKLNGMERDIAVQKDIFEQAKRRKVVEIYVQSLRFKLQTTRQDLSSIKERCDPVKVFIFESLIGNIELAIDRGISCETTLKQLDRLVAYSYILFFEKKVASKRRFTDCCNLDGGCSNKVSRTTRVANDHLSKRMKENPMEYETKFLTIDMGIIANGTPSSNDDDGESFETNDLDWNIDSSK